jgi:undecaprenyl-diphosphatase
VSRRKTAQTRLSADATPDGSRSVCGPPARLLGVLTTSRRRLALSAAGLAVGFVVLAVRVTVAGGVPGDQALLESLQPGSAADVDGPARAVDLATGSQVIAVVAALLAGALLLTGRVRDAVFVGLAVGGVLLANPLLKRAVDRPRPDLLAAPGDVSPLSFPSGHAAATAACAVTVVLLAAGTRWSRAVVATAAVLVLGTGASQLVLARHHPTDLLGGWLWASAWVLAVAVVLRRSA